VLDLKFIFLNKTIGQSFRKNQQCHIFVNGGSNIKIDLGSSSILV
jgi:hypothetical protein